MAAPKNKLNKVSLKKRVVKKIKKATKRTPKKKKQRALDLRRSNKNPIIDPAPNSYWESEAVFNPGAVIHGGRVHLFYRALGAEGVSRVGYASSKDGIHFDRRSSHPVYVPESVTESARHYSFTSPARLSYNRGLYVSGGGWGGCEDPRAVKIDDRVYLTFNMFNGWHSVRVAFTSISENDLEQGRWNWQRLAFLSPPDEVHKNWVFFPEKINGKFAILHNIAPKITIEYVDDLDVFARGKFIESCKEPTPRRHAWGNPKAWDTFIRSAGPPPIKTPYGWLLFYHAMSEEEYHRYKLGAMLLDLDDPSKILYRSSYPVLEPDEWYENDWKPGIIYASGAVVIDGILFVYYGGGDKHIGVAQTNLDDFIQKLMKNEHATFSIKSAKVA